MTTRRAGRPSDRSRAAGPARPAAWEGRGILVVSDATGRTAEMVVRAALVQFQGADVKIEVRPHVRTTEEARRAVAEAAASGCLIVHTLVSADLRRVVLTEAQAKDIPTIDLLGPLLLRLEDLLKLQPLAKPGLFRDQEAEYRHRFEVMDFTVRHDDGQDAHGLPSADIILVGVSRTSKTPLSMFLAWRGLRVANVPIVLTLPLPEELSRVHPRKVVGLTIKPERLLELRRSRLQQMETPPQFPYADTRQIYGELEYAQQACRQAGWPIVDVTDKSIEEVAAEVLVLTGIESPAPRRSASQPGIPSAWRRTSE
jgi:regulator of PEP synthase PpsR (kinase-PPPase family)